MSARIIGGQYHTTYFHPFYFTCTWNSTDLIMLPCSPIINQILLSPRPMAHSTTPTTHILILLFTILPGLLDDSTLYTYNGLGTRGVAGSAEDHRDLWESPELSPVSSSVRFST